MTTASLESGSPTGNLTHQHPAHYPAHDLVSDVGSAVLNDAEAIKAVALHVAATALSTTATLAERERVRVAWAGALRVAHLCDHPRWHLVFLPGMTFDDGETWAVHRRTGRVVGGDCPETAQDSGESTEEWLNRLS